MRDDDPDIVIVVGAYRETTCLMRQEIWYYYELNLPLLMLDIIKQAQSIMNLCQISILIFNPILGVTFTLNGS